MGSVVSTVTIKVYFLVVIYITKFRFYKNHLKCVF
jgi:hypothetical protein